MTLIDAQIADLDATAIEYCANISNPRNSDEDIRTYWNTIAQGWMLVLGLRKAQLMSLRRYNGLVLVA